MKLLIGKVLIYRFFGSIKTYIQFGDYRFILIIRVYNVTIRYNSFIVGYSSMQLNE